MNPNTIDSIIKQLIASHTTLATMESCTSGLIAALILNYLCTAAEGKLAIQIIHTCGVFGNGTAFQRTCPAIKQYTDGIAADYAAVQVERAACHRNAGGTTADFAILAVHQSEGAAVIYGNCRSTARGCDTIKLGDENGRVSDKLYRAYY